MTDIPREERTSIIPIPCHWSMEMLPLVKDGQGFPHKLELDVKLYALFDRFELDDLSFLNEQERHLDQTELSEALLSRRVPENQATVEDAVYESLQTQALEKESGGCRKSRKEGCRCISLMDSPTKKLRNGKDAAIKRYRSP